MRSSDWSSDVCSSDLPSGADAGTPASLADAHDQLAEIVAAQQADQTGGGVFEAVDHILDDGDLAVTQPCAHLFDKRGVSGLVVLEDQEALQRHAARQDLPQPLGSEVGAIAGLGAVVVCNQATECDACMAVDQRQGRFPDRSEEHTSELQSLM